MKMFKLLSILLITLSFNSYVHTHNHPRQRSYQEIQDERYRLQRAQDERDYVKALENGEYIRKPYANEQYDREHGYHSSWGYGY